MFWSLTIMIAGSASAVQSNPSAICVEAAQTAGSASGVPVSVLLAISQTETGRSAAGETLPWPWTVNMEGEGHWFETRDAAQAFVFENYNRGARSFDIGCFQINFRWHGQNFSSIEDMFDPVINAEYAAKFLSDLYRERGDWSAAAGAFHSRTETLAARYRATFDDFRAAAIAAGADTGTAITRADPLLVAVATGNPSPRDNTFPLLQSRTGNRSPGSLVTLSP